MIETIKVTGIYFNEPREKAPDFVDGDLNIKVEAFIKFLHSQDSEYVKLDILKGRENGRYLKLNTFKPDGSRRTPDSDTNTTQATGQQPKDSDVPFSPVELF